MRLSGGPNITMGGMFLMTRLIVTNAQSQGSSNGPLVTSAVKHQERPRSAAAQAPSTYVVPPFSTSPPNSTATGQPDPNGDSFDVTSYYYVFIAVVVVLFGVGFFFWDKRRRRRKMNSRFGRQTALRQDLDNYQSSQRRWLHGMHWRENPALTRYQRGLRRQREEGLNERGEAPPPYVAGESSTGTRDAPSYTPESDVPTDGVTIPLQAMTRSPNAAEPPDYDSMMRPAR